jgi:probable HAF family extracellular repeat protein
MSRIVRSFVSAALFVLASGVAFVSHAGAATREYAIHDLGPAAPGAASEAMAINAIGQAVGWTAASASGQPSPALFEVGVPPVVLNSLSGVAVAINRGGDVIGEKTYTDRFAAFFWRDGVTTDVPSLGGPLGTLLHGLNDRGTAIGWSQATDGAVHAVLFRRGRLVDLGTWGADAAQGHAINNQGVMIGTRDVNETATREGVRVSPEGVVEVLAPQVGMPWVAPLAINRAGDVAGQMSQYRYFEGPRFGFVLIAGVTQTVALPGASVSNALSINDRGAVVGYSDAAGVFEPRAILFERGVATDLNALPGLEAAGWARLVSARGINNAGEIVGYGIKLTGETRAFKLVPR